MALRLMGRARAASRASGDLVNLRFEVHTEVHTHKSLYSLPFVNLVNLVNLFRAHPYRARARVPACVKGRKKVHKVHKVHIFHSDQWVGSVNLGFEGSHFPQKVHTRSHLQVDPACSEPP